MIYRVVVFLAALISGAVASIAGFGIGSILTPLLSSQVPTRVAVAIVAFPHFAGTLLRFWLLRRNLNWRVFTVFGIASAAGGLTGALLHVWFQSFALGYILGALLVFAGLTGITGAAARMRFGRLTGVVAGALSGMFGGLVGNQGGIRSAALLGFGLEKASFVATATAIGLVVDVFRMPVYAAFQWRDLSDQRELILISLVGVLIGTVSGKFLLQRIPEKTFRGIVYVLVLALGIAMLVRPGGND